MSTYEKPTKKCQDALMGFRTINQLAANQDAVLHLLQVEHMPTPEQPPNAPAGADVSGGTINLGSTIDVIGGGQHATPKVARGTLGVDVVSSLLTIGSATVRYRTGLCHQLVRVSLGVYFVPIFGCTDFYGEATVKSDDNTTTRKTDVIPTSTIVVSTTQVTVIAPGLFIILSEEQLLDSGALGFDLADFSFDLTVYGRRGELLETEFPWPQHLGARRARRWHPRGRVVKPL